MTIHKWVAANDVVRWPHCERCGIIQRHDGNNNPICKGVPRISIRKHTHLWKIAPDGLHRRCICGSEQVWSAVKDTCGAMKFQRQTERKRINRHEP